MPFFFFPNCENVQLSNCSSVPANLAFLFWTQNHVIATGDFMALLLDMRLIFLREKRH